jgi:tRNA nucleotidyltransferase (CCA-adding enzyme)
MLQAPETLSIDDALLHLWGKAPYLLGAQPWLALYAGCSKVALSTSPVCKQAHYLDALRMQAMGLGHLPLAGIACLPTRKPRLKLERGKKTSSSAPRSHPKEVSWFPPVACEAEAFEQQTTTEPNATANLNFQLCQVFPVKFVAALYELESLFKRFNRQGYLIGGLTRDLVLTHEGKQAIQDIDITIVGDAIETARLIETHSKNFVLDGVYPEFGTAKLTYKNVLALDLASTRQETYSHCGALPKVTQQGVVLAKDVLRRDFTMNTLALSLHPLGLVLDYTSGLADLEVGRLRVLHGASFYEDPSRILRAYKFASRMGFSLAKETQHLIQQTLTYLPQCAYTGGGHRIRSALKAWVGLPETPTKQFFIALFLQQGGLRLLCPMETLLLERTSEQLQQRLEPFWQHYATLLETLDSKLKHNETADEERLWLMWLCWLMEALPSEAFRQHVAERLELTKLEREAIKDYLQMQSLDAFAPSSASASSPVQTTERLTPSAIYHLFANRTPAACLAYIIVKQPFDTFLAAYRRFSLDYESIHIELNGKELQGLGVPYGPFVGQVMTLLLEERLLGQVSSRQDEIDFVERWLEEQTLELEDDV